MSKTPCILLVAPPDSYRVAPYIYAAQSLGAELKIASHGEHSLVNEIAAGIHIDLNFPETAVETIVNNAMRYNFTGIVAADDKATEIAAQAAKALNLPHNPPSAVHLTRWKHKARQTLRDAKLPVPDFRECKIDDVISGTCDNVEFPCVIKPINLSASRGVIRCNNFLELQQAAKRVAKIIEPLENEEAQTTVLIERFITGHEVALEAILRDGKLYPIALFDKLDPLEGPFFEETYYVTPSRLNSSTQSKIHNIIEQACAAYGLVTGPIHAELRINKDELYIIEIAARTIGGECAKLIELASEKSLESIVIDYAMGKKSPPIKLDKSAGVMMIPTPRSGILRRVEGVLNAQNVPHINSVAIAIREGHELVTLPEGASYLGFIFATAETPEQVETALRSSYEALTIVVNPLWKMTETTVD